ncbi:hypothetical protein ER57_07850 [Smithella sp. SCADC]|jgi:hypothetical protein|nr:hypothetical protein ER57_07850 [Smithella sp. SCADC]
MRTQQWKFDPTHNRITAIEPGNCRITIADKIYGVDMDDWEANGRLMAMAPRLAELPLLILETATIETNKQVLEEAGAILRELEGLDQKEEKTK